MVSSVSPDFTVCQLSATRSDSGVSLSRFSSVSAVPSGTFSEYAAPRTGVVQRRSSGLSCSMVSTGVPVHSATRRRSSGPATSTVSRGIGEDGVKLKPYCAGFRAMTMAARIIGTYSRVSRGSQRLLELSSQKSSLPVRFIARCTRPGPPLYDASARCQSPSKMRLSVFRYFAAALRRLFGIRPLVDVPVVPQAVLERRRVHELPDAPRALHRQRVGLECALDQRHVREIERQTFSAEDVLDHRQVLAAAIESVLDEGAEPSLEQLDVPEHLLVLRDRNVVRGLGQVRLHGGRDGARRHRVGRVSRTSPAADRARPARSAFRRSHRRSRARRLRAR